MGASSLFASIGSWLMGNTIAEHAQIETAKHFKRGIGAAIIVSLISAFLGMSGGDLGGLFLSVFALVYGWCSYKWLLTKEGAQCIDARMFTDREKEIPFADHWEYFTYFVTFGVILVMMLPLALIHNPWGIWITAALLLVAPGNLYWRHRDAI